MTQFRSPVIQAYNVSESCLPGAKLYFYAAGTTTFQDTYRNARLTIKNENPVIANSWGFFPDIYLGASNYNIVMTDKDDNQIFSLDPLVVGSENDIGYD